MNIFDIHCDTPFELYRKKLPLKNGVTAVSPQKAAMYEKKVYVTAFWSDNRISEEDCYKEFLNSSLYFDNLIKESSNTAMLCTNANELSKAALQGKFGIIKAVEGARLIGTELSRLETIKKCGISILVPMWSGSEIVGGAWDTNEGLTNFGRNLLQECKRLNIIADVSHMSEKSFWETLEISEKNIIASHSNCRSLCAHSRNLDDSQIKALIQAGGLMGLNLCQKHISAKYAHRFADESDDFIFEAAQHIMHILELGGKNVSCIGCDFDGTEPSVHIPDTSHMPLLYKELLSLGVSKEIADNIFFNNAYNFFINNIM